MLGLCRGKRACRPASLGGGCQRAAGAAPRQVHPPEARAASIERPAGRCAGSGRRGEQLRLLAAGGGLFRVSGELPAELSAPKELFLAPLQRRSSAASNLVLCISFRLLCVAAGPVQQQTGDRVLARCDERGWSQLGTRPGPRLLAGGGQQVWKRVRV